MSRIGSLSNNSITDFNATNSTTNNANSPTKSATNKESQPTNKVSSEEIKQSTQNAGAAIKTTVDNIKNGESQVKNAGVNVKASAEKVLEAAKNFSKNDPISFINLKQGSVKLESDIQKLKQGVETTKKGSQDLAEITRIGILPLKQATKDCDGMEASKQQVNKLETELDKAIESTGRGLRASDDAIARGVDRGLQTIKYGINLINGSSEKAIDFIKSGAEAVGRGVDTVTREVSQAAKNVYQAGSEAVSSLYDVANKLNPGDAFRPIGLQSPINTKPNQTSSPSNPLSESPQSADKQSAKIDRSQLSTLESAIVDATGLENIKPGQKISLGGSVNGKLGAVLGFDLGESAKASIERSQSDPNKFSITLEKETRIDAGADLKALGEGGSAKAGVSDKDVITFQLDLSKKGEPTELAGFIGQTGLAALLPVVGLPLVSIGLIPGVKLPGEPLDYLKNHLKSVEISGGAGAEATAKGVVALGLSGTVAGKLALGGKLEFNDDGTRTLTASANSSLKGESKIFAGIPSLSVGTPSVSTEFNLSFEQTYTYSKDNKFLEQDTRLKLVGRGQALVKGAEVELSTSVKDLVNQVPADVSKRLKSAVESKNYAEVSKIIQNEIIPNADVKFDAKVRPFTSYKGSVDAEASLEGTGFDASVEVESEISDRVREGKGQLTKDGLKINGEKVDLNSLQNKLNPPSTEPKTPVRRTLQVLNRGMLGNLLG